MEAARFPFGFGPLMSGVGDVLVPAERAADIRNLDFDQVGECARRDGFVHGLTSALTGQARFLAAFELIDGTQVLLVGDDSGLRQE
jgi:hypothetical protein